MKKPYLFLCCMGILGFARAQQETTLNTMRGLPQASYTNPALIPAPTFYLGLPGISSVGVFGASNSLNYNNVEDLGLEGDNENFSSASLRTLRGQMLDKNWVAAGAQVDLLSFGFKAGPRLYFRYRAAMHVNQRTQLPPDLLLLADQEFLNTSSQVQLEPSLHLLAYLENSLGASYVINPGLTIGVTIKRLNGMASVSTEQMDFQLRSDPAREELELEGEFLAYTSGYDFFQNLDDLEPQEIQDKFYSNGGWAVDLGATFQLSPRLQMGLSVLDLGAISWSDDAKQYRTNRRSFSFKSLDAENGDEEQERYEDFVEGISENFEPQETTVESFRTALPTRLYVTATYELYRNVAASGIYFSELYEGRYLPGFTAALHKDFGRVLGLSVSYTAINNAYANLGLGFSLRLTPFQLYVVTDNALAGLDWESAKNVNARAGLNLVFGATKKPSKLPY